MTAMTDLEWEAWLSTSVRITADDAARLDSDHLRQLLEFAERLKG